MIRADMHCMNTFPLWCSSRDLNMGANGNLWPLYNSDKTWKGVPDFDPFPPCSMKKDLGYEKEVLKQIMLKQEAIFVDQVSELHRLYRKQKELMDGVEKRKFLQCQMKPQHYSSQLEPELAEKTVLSTTNLQPSSSSKWSQQMSDKRKKPAKRIFDLELPADAYIDSEEGEQFVDKKNCGLFDLNGPVQVEEEEMFSNNLMPNVDLKVQCSTFSLSLAKNQEPSEYVNLGIESTQRSHDLHMQNYPRSVSSCIGTSQQLVPPSYMVKPKPFSAVSLIKPCENLRHIPMAAHSLPCFKTPPPSLHMSYNLPIGNQRMSLNNYHFNGNFAASPSVEGISSLMNNLFFKSHLESMNLKATSLEVNTETDCLTQMESGVSQALMFSSNFDLERLGYSASQNYDKVLEDKSCIISPTASNTTHPNWIEKVGNLGGGSDCLFTNIGDDKKPSGFGVLVDLNSCVTENEMTLDCSVPSTVTKTEIEIDLEAPVSPENKEGSPPRGESEEHPIEPSLQLSEHKDKDQHGELVRVAAEAIVSLSSSEKLHADNNCLLWFAGIISSVKREDVMSLPRHQRKERTRRARLKKDFQMGSLTCLAEGDLSEPNGLPTYKDSKKSAVTKGRRKSRKLKANEEEPCLMKSCLRGWGKINRRKRGRRIAVSNPHLIFQIGGVMSS